MDDLIFEQVRHGQEQMIEEFCMAIRYQIWNRTGITEHEKQRVYEVFEGGIEEMKAVFFGLGVIAGYSGASEEIPVSEMVNSIDVFKKFVHKSTHWKHVERNFKAIQGGKE